MKNHTERWTQYAMIIGAWTAIALGFWYFNNDLKARASPILFLMGGVIIGVVMSLGTKGESKYFEKFMGHPPEKIVWSARYGRVPGWFKRRQLRREKRCVVCERELHQSVIDLAHGSFGGGPYSKIEVKIRGLPVHTCGVDGHPLRYAQSDFIFQLRLRGWVGKNTAVAKMRGVSWYKCFNCGEDISNLRPGTKGKVSGTLEIGKLPTFEVEIEGPTTSCPKCGMHQLLDQSCKYEDVLPRAVKDSFRSINLS